MSRKDLIERYERAISALEGFSGELSVLLDRLGSVVDGKFNLTGYPEQYAYLGGWVDGVSGAPPDLPLPAALDLKDRYLGGWVDGYLMFICRKERWSAKIGSDYLRHHKGVIEKSDVVGLFDYFIHGLRMHPALLDLGVAESVARGEFKLIEDMGCYVGSLEETIRNSSASCAQ